MREPIVRNTKITTMIISTSFHFFSMINEVAAFENKEKNKSKFILISVKNHSLHFVEKSIRSTSLV
jgi:hypothetical protein